MPVATSAAGGRKWVGTEILLVFSCFGSDVQGDRGNEEVKAGIKLQMAECLENYGNSIKSFSELVGETLETSCSVKEEKKMSLWVVN